MDCTLAVALKIKPPNSVKLRMTCGTRFSSTNSAKTPGPDGGASGVAPCAITGSGESHCRAVVGRVASSCCSGEGRESPRRTGRGRVLEGAAPPFEGGEGVTLRGEGVMPPCRGRNSVGGGGSTQLRPQVEGVALPGFAHVSRGRAGREGLGEGAHTNTRNWRLGGLA